MSRIIWEVISLSMWRARNVDIPRASYDSCKFICVQLRSHYTFARCLWYYGRHGWRRGEGISRISSLTCRTFTRNFAKTEEETGSPCGIVRALNARETRTNLIPRENTSFPPTSLSISIFSLSSHARIPKEGRASWDIVDPDTARGRSIMCNMRS